MAEAVALAADGAAHKAEPAEDLAEHRIHKEASLVFSFSILYFDRIEKKNMEKTKNREQIAPCQCVDGVLRRVVSILVRVTTSRMPTAMQPAMARVWVP